MLAITQCTTLMPETRLARPRAACSSSRALVVLGGYAWLTSVVDPEEGAVRIVIFAAMAALLVAALCVPGAFGDDALAFASRTGRADRPIGLFLIASRDEPVLRRSVVGLAVGTTIGVGLLVAASATDGAVQAGLWCLAIVLDLGLPFLFWAEGWQLVPAHFAERHGLILIIALGESIVAIGIGSNAVVDVAVVVAVDARDRRRGGALVGLLRRHGMGRGTPSLTSASGTGAERGRA